MKKKQKKGLHIKPAISGKGLFSEFSIKKEEYIAEYTGKILTGKEAEAASGLYLFALGDGTIIDGVDEENIARYINHGCRPNCEARVEEGRIYFYAIRDIQPEEELFFDYGKPYFENIIKPQGCNCPHCKKLKE